MIRTYAPTVSNFMANNGILQITSKTALAQELSPSQRQTDSSVPCVTPGCATIDRFRRSRSTLPEILELNPPEWQNSHNLTVELRKILTQELITRFRANSTAYPQSYSGFVGCTVEISKAASTVEHHLATDPSVTARRQMDFAPFHVVVVVKVQFNLNRVIGVSRTVVFENQNERLPFPGAQVVVYRRLFLVQFGHRI